MTVTKKRVESWHYEGVRIYASTVRLQANLCLPTTKSIQSDQAKEIVSTGFRLFAASQHFDEGTDPRIRIE